MKHDLFFEKICQKPDKQLLFLQSAQNRLLIKNGKVVNADGIQDADVYIEEGVIKWVTVLKSVKLLCPSCIDIVLKASGE